MKIYLKQKINIFVPYHLPMCNIKVNLVFLGLIPKSSPGNHRGLFSSACTMVCSINRPIVVTIILGNL